MPGPLDPSTRRAAIRAADQAAAAAIAPFRRWLSASVADEIALVTSDALLFQRAARRALVEAVLPRLESLPSAAMSAGAPGSSAVPRKAHARPSRTERLVLSARTNVARMAKYIVASVGGDAAELEAVGMLAVSEEAARWTESLDAFVDHATAVARDAMRYARKKEVRLRRRHIGTIRSHLSSHDGPPSSLVSRLANVVTMSEVLRLDRGALGHRADDRLGARQLERDLAEAIEALDPPDRRLLEAFYERAETLRAIAARERWPYVSAKRRHHDALERLCGLLVDRGHRYGTVPSTRRPLRR